MSQFLCVRNLCPVSLGPLSVFPDCKQNVGCCWLGERLLPSSLMWALTGFGCSCATGLRTSIPVGGELEAILSSLPRGPFHWRSSQRGRGFITSHKQKAAGCASEMEATIFYSLILAVASHHFSHILFVRNKSIGPAHIHDEGITQRGAAGRWHPWQPVQWLPTASEQAFHRVVN